MKRNFEDLKTLMDERIAELGFSGIDCVIYQHHQEIFRHAAGYGDMENKRAIQPGQMCNIYSGTKMITCVAGMQLVEKGKMILSEPLHHYLPEFKDMVVKHGTFVVQPAKKPIRVVDVFTMTAGISYDLDTPHVRKLMAETGGDFNTRDLVRAIAKEPLLFEPGEGWNYSYCHDVLGALIEVISGMTFGDYLRKNIFEPLGMKDATFTLGKSKRDKLYPQYQYDSATKSVTRATDDCLGRAGTRHESGGGGLIMSADDYILFADALACDGVGKSGARIISSRSLDLMTTPQLSGQALADFRKMMPSPGYGYGLGVGVYFDPAASLVLLPKGSFGWGGLGGVQNLIDRENKLSYYVSQHLLHSPKSLISSRMKNVLYANL
ncbi:MAG: beta-lactamase family protein [Turicibacter sp.]|nr:beta-lactamase family protein [Turicibacter sp.]